MFGFGKKSPSVDMAKCEIKKCSEDEIKKAEPEEWIWVNGYKGTDKDMKCRDMQYELQKCFDIPEDKPVELCGNGFHLCKYLREVYNFYPVGGNNRFFEVKALVRKGDWDHYLSGSRYSHPKIVAKSIIFTRELTTDEILLTYGITNWAEEDKKLVLEVGIDEACRQMRTRELTKLGYSETFAQLIACNGSTSQYRTALAVGGQEGLSMDMKVWSIFANK